MIAAAVPLALVLALAPVETAHRQVRVPGGALAVTRYAPPARGVGQPPVVLVPPLGFSRAVFDLQERGLARWLADRGFLVYVVEPRGQGPSTALPALGELVTTDLPAALSAIAADTEGPVDLVVQGWSGTLALVATTKELKGRVRRVVALNTPVIGEVPNAAAEEFLRQGGRFSGLGASPDGAWTFDQVFALDAKLPLRAREALLASRLRDLSPPVAAGLLGWWRSGDLELPDGSTVSARLRAYRLPTLQLLGIADGFSPPELSSPLREVSPAKVQVRVFARFEDGEDYSHVSMLLGRRAPKDVFPRIEHFLREGEEPW